MLSKDNGRYIEETVRSVLSQTYQNWEVIFMDDSSKDDTISQMMDYVRDRRIKVLQNVKSKGAWASMGSALRDARGKWIAFLNVGDVWEPAKLEKQLAFMEENGYHFSYHKTRRMDRESRPVGGVLSGKMHITHEDMMKCCWPAYLTVMYDAEKVGRIKTINQKQENDYALWLQVAYSADCHLLDECLSRHRANKWFYNRFPIGHNILWRYEVYRKIEYLNPFVSAMYTLRNLWYGLMKKVKYVERG